MPQSRPRYQWLLIILAALVVLSSIVAVVPPVISYVKEHKQKAREQRRAYDAAMVKRFSTPQDLSPFKGNFAGVKMAISKAYIMPVPGAIVYEGDESIWSPKHKTVDLDERTYTDTFDSVALVMGTTNYEGSISKKNRFKERNPYDVGENKWVQVDVYAVNPINLPDIEEKYTQIYRSSRENDARLDLHYHFRKFLAKSKIDLDLDQCYEKAFENSVIKGVAADVRDRERAYCDSLFDKKWLQYQHLYLAQHNKPAYIEGYRQDLGLKEYIPTGFRSIDSPPAIEYVDEQNGIYKTLIKCNNNLSGKAAKIPQSEMSCTHYFVIPKYQAQVRVSYHYKFLKHWKTYQQRVTERLQTFEVKDK